MKMQLKRIVSAVCAVALCASVVTTPVLAEDAATTVPDESTVALTSDPANSGTTDASDEATDVTTEVTEEPKAEDAEVPTAEATEELTTEETEKTTEEGTEEPTTEAGEESTAEPAEAPTTEVKDDESVTTGTTVATAPRSVAAAMSKSNKANSSDDGVAIGKTATDLDENYQTKVTLSVGGQESMENVAVLFVFDKSTSVDVRNAAKSMMDELATKQHTNIKVAVVNFNKNAEEASWQDFNTMSDEDREKLFTNVSTAGGTNYQAGLLEAEDLLDDPSIQGYTPYLITVSDGITYIWNEDTNGDGVSEPAAIWSNYSDRNSAGSSTQKGSDSWQFKYKANNVINGFEYLYSDGIDEFIEQAGQAYQKTKDAGLIYGYDDAIVPGETKIVIVEGDGGSLATGKTLGYATANSSTGSYDTYESVDENYLIGPEAAVYKTAEAFQAIMEKMNASGNGNHVYALSLPEDENYWVSNPFGRELMKYLGAQTSTTVDDTEISNSTAQKTFEDIKDEILYSIMSGTVTDVIGDDFDLAGLDTFQLKVGDSTFEGDVNEEANTVSFDNGSYVVTYAPKGQNGDAREQFQWSINTPVKSDEGLQLTYTLNLVNQTEVVDDYTVPTNEEADLKYTSSTGGSGDRVFPIPTVTYHVAKLEPATMTIYMGGDEGYEGVSEADGEIVGSNSLPEPGFYITLPSEVNAALQAAKIQTEEGTDGEPVNLSNYIKIYTTDASDPRVWTLSSYGATYSAAYNKFIYKVEPAEGTEDAFRLNFVSEDGNTVYNSDDFKLDDLDNLSQTYKMRVYPDLVENHQVIIEVDIPKTASTEAVNYRCTMITGEADLDIRYVTNGEQMTEISNDIAATSKEEDPEQTALKNAYVVANEGTKFYINESKVDVDADAKVSLLFDDIVSSEDSTEATDYKTELEDTALTKINTTLKDAKFQSKYLDLVNANNGNVWLTPSEEVTVYWPYPEGTNSSTKFYLVHFKGLDRDDIALDQVESSINAAETELMELDTDQYGISFKTSSFSPFVLMWDGSQGQTTTPSTNTPSTTPKPVSVTSTKPAQPQPAATPVIPQTGDALPVGLLGGVTAVAAAAFVALFVVRKRKKD